MRTNSFCSLAIDCHNPTQLCPPIDDGGETPMTENAPTGLRIDAGGDDFPTSGPAPRLSWYPAAGAGAGAGYELEATVDGEKQPIVRADGHRLVDWPWRELRSGETVRWQVRA